MGSKSFTDAAGICKVTISYDYYTNSSGNNVFKVTGVKTTAEQGGWASWELSPVIMLYIVPGSTDMPAGTNNHSSSERVKDWAAERTGYGVTGKALRIYAGNHPSDYISNSSGGTKTWESDDFSSAYLSGLSNTATVTIGCCIINDGSSSIRNLLRGSITVSGISFYTAPKGYAIECTDATATSFKVRHKWTAGSDSLTSNKIVIDKYNYDAGEWDTSYRTYTSLGNGSTVTFGESAKLPVNSYYKITGTINDGTTKLTDSVYAWTRPTISKNGLTLELDPRKEHQSIIVTAKADVYTPYDQFNFSSDGGNTWTGWTSRGKSATHIFKNLNANTEYNIAFKMRNARSDDTKTPYYAGGSASNATVITKSITTWHTPLSSLNIVLDNSWYWYLAIKANFTYQGTIKEYKFSMTEKDLTSTKKYVSTGTTNLYSEGATDYNSTDKLKYNTEYKCKVQIEDEYGRIYSSDVQSIDNSYNMPNAINYFKTLDMRPVYLNGELKEAMLVRPDGTQYCITPNMLNVLRTDGTTINLNKIINNDDRAQFK